jgi:hypothetical protein
MIGNHPQEKKSRYGKSVPNAMQCQCWMRVGEGVHEREGSDVNLQHLRPYPSDDV